jgi:hypothetical protein
MSQPYQSTPITSKRKPRRKPPAEDKTTARPIIIKSPLRRYERPKS